MHHISRRNFVLSATAASAAFGLDGPLEFIGSAQAQSYANTKLVDKGFHKFKVGNVEVTQTTYLVGSGKQQLLVLGDVTSIPILFVKNPGWQGVFDADGALAETNRRKMMDRAIVDKLTVAGYHYSMPGAGTFKKDGNGYVFIPVTA